MYDVYFGDSADILCTELTISSTMQMKEWKTCNIFRVKKRASFPEITDFYGKGE